MEYISLEKIAKIESNLITSKKREFKESVKIKELKIGMIKSRTYIEKTESETQQEKSKLKDFKILENDIIIKRVSPLFVTIIRSNEELYLGPNLTRIRIEDKFFLPSFVACYIDSKIKSITRQDAKIPLLMLQQLKELKIPMIEMEKQEIIGNVWVRNSKQLEIDTKLANYQFEYNQNLILEKIGEIK